MRYVRGLLFLTLLAGCSLQSRDHARLSLEISPEGSEVGLQAGKSAVGRVAYAPATVDQFDCYAIVVTGTGIDVFDYAKNSACTDFGSSSALVSASTGGEINLTVPSGSARLIRLVGIRFPRGSSYQCSSFASLSDYASGAGAAGLRGVLAVAEATQDVFTDSTVELTNSYTGADSSKFAFSCVTAAAPTITAVAPGNLPVAGATSITITGSEFDPAMTVSVDGADCATPVVDSLGTQATCTPAAHAAGAVSVSIRNPDGNGAVSTSALTFYSPLSLTAASSQALASTSVSLTAANGVAPYGYQVKSGSGTVSSSGTYTTASSAGTDVIEVKDSLGNSASATVAVYSRVAWESGATTIAVNRTLSLRPTGGLAPYTYRISSGSASGSISGDSSGAALTASGTGGTVVAEVTDSLGSAASATVTVVETLAGYTPRSGQVLGGSSISVTYAGGGLPLSVTVTSGNGALSATSDSRIYSYLASGGSLSSTMTTSATAVIRATDSTGQTADVTLTVKPALRLTPAANSIAVGNTTSITVTGGIGTLSVSIVSGGGSLDPTTYAFTASSSAGSVVIRATDAESNSAQTSIAVADALAISPTSVTMSMARSVTFAASGGVSPYSFSLTSGSGVVGVTTGILTSSTIAGTSVVRTYDSIGNAVSATALVVAGGTPDTRFGSNGSATVSNTYSTSLVPMAMARDTSAGKLAHAGYASFSGNDGIILSQVTSTGVPDTDFGIGGTVITTLTGKQIHPRAVAYQSDGKILVSGSVYNSGTGSYWAFLARYTSTGTLDTTFSNTMGGSNGFVEFCWLVSEACGLAYDPVNASAIMILSDGKILVGGAGKGTLVGSGYRAAMAKFNTDGSFDTGFRTTGRALYDPGTSSANSEILALYVESSNAIVAGGSATATSYPAFILKTDSGGTLDTTFGDPAATSGCASKGCHLFDYAGSGSTDTIAGITEDSAGRILVTGKAGYDIGLTRLTTVGAADTSFGSSGSITIDAGTSYDGGSGILIDHAGHLLIRADVGMSSDAATCLIRTNDAGQLDGTFSPTASTPGMLCESKPPGGSSNTSGLAIDSDDNIYLGLQMLGAYSTMGIRRFRP